MKHIKQFYKRPEKNRLLEEENQKLRDALLTLSKISAFHADAILQATEALDRALQLPKPETNKE